jgi:nitroreductase
MNPESEEPIGEDVAALHVMATTRAMRRLNPDPVPEQLLKRLIEAATYAPTAGNAQTNEFVVVTDRDQMQRLAVLWCRCVDAYLDSFGKMPPETLDVDAFQRVRKAVDYQRDHFHETPALVIPCFPSTGRSPREIADTLRGLAALGPANVARVVAGSGRLTTLTDAASVYLGVQNILLAARTLGLAANITMWHLLLEHEWNKALGIPSGVRTFAVIPVGWPMGRFGPVTRRPVEQTIHHDRW